jgi:hypothetical protein
MSDALTDKEHEDNIPNMGNIYFYTEGYIKSRLEVIQKLESKILATLAFSGVTLKVVSDLPNASKLQTANGFFCYSCLLLKTFSCLAVIVAIVTLVLTIRFKPKVSAISPKEVIKKIEWLKVKKSEWQSFVFKNWYSMDEDIQIIIKNKGESLNKALIMLMLASIFYIFHVLLSTYYG